MKDHETFDEKPERLLSEPEVQRITGLSRVTRWRLEQERTFPARLNISPGRVAWRLSDIEGWIEGLATTPGGKTNESL